VNPPLVCDIGLCLEYIFDVPRSANHHPRRKWQDQISRKEARKHERIVRKQNKAEFFSTNAARHKRPAEENHEESPNRKKPKHDKTIPSIPPAASQPSAQSTYKAEVAPTKPLPPSILKTSKKTRTPLEKLAGGSNAPPTTFARTRKEEEEDSYIAYLESKLGYAKGSKRKKFVEDDGLDGKPV
jgi:nucleolar MIF4G domain-containing protein 1